MRSQSRDPHIVVFAHSIAKPPPSFKVFADHYHCYGCGAHGNGIDFVMNKQGLDLPRGGPYAGVQDRGRNSSNKPNQANHDRHGKARDASAGLRQHQQLLLGPNGGRPCPPWPSVALMTTPSSALALASLLKPGQRSATIVPSGVMRCSKQACRAAQRKEGVLRLLPQPLAVPGPRRQWRRDWFRRTPPGRRRPEVPQSLRKPTFTRRGSVLFDFNRLGRRFA